MGPILSYSSGSGLAMALTAAAWVVAAPQKIKFDDSGSVVEERRPPPPTSHAPASVQGGPQDRHGGPAAGDKGHPGGRGRHAEDGPKPRFGGRPTGQARPEKSAHGAAGGGASIGGVKQKGKGGRDKERPDSRPVHPSWEAKQRARKAQQQREAGAKPAGKKIVFAD